MIDQQTAKLVAVPNPSMAVVNLRVRVLDAQSRRPEMETFLDSIANSTTSIEQAEEIEVLAEQKSLESVRQHALEKQAVLTTDPVNRLQLRYRLVQLYESRKDFPSAQRNVEALYRENPKILGVVRSTVDFYWRTKNPAQAIAVLLQASKDAYPELSKQFVFEAARKSTDAGQYAQARDLLTGLLKTSPYDGQYLAAMADTYAQAGDDRGLRQFYLDKIALFRSAPFSGEERKTRIATLRRGLIPALTRMKDYAGAVDQYVELINNFPEDAGLVTEAALYALRYQRQQQLLEFYARTVTQSPRDYRWPMVLAQIQTSLEQYPAAIESYGKAVTVRPDRVDLRTARAGLEERLMRFDEAAGDYERIYQLAFKDPKWMEKVAEIRARQGRADDAVAALKTALIDVGPENSEKYFEVARRLESWGMLTQARVFAEQGVSTAGVRFAHDGRAAIRGKNLCPHHDPTAPAGKGLCDVAERSGGSIGSFAGAQGTACSARDCRNHRQGMARPHPGKPPPDRPRRHAVGAERNGKHSCELLYSRRKSCLRKICRNEARRYGPGGRGRFCRSSGTKRGTGRARSSLAL